MSPPVEQPQTTGDRIKATLEKIRRARLRDEEVAVLEARRDRLPPPPPGVTRADLEASINRNRQVIADMDVAINESRARRQVIKEIRKEMKSLISALKTGRQAQEVRSANIERTAREWADDEPGTGMTPERMAKVAELQREFADCEEQFQQIKREWESLTQRADRVQRRV